MFLKTQFKIYNDTMDTEEIIPKIKQAKTGEEIIQLVTSHSLKKFQMVGYIEEYPRVFTEK